MTNNLYNSGQVVALATGQSYTIKTDEVFLNSTIYKKADLETSIHNNGALVSPEEVLIGVIKRDGIRNLPSHYVPFDNWYIDGVQQTSLSSCVENIATALFIPALISFTQQVNQYNDLVAGTTVGDLAYVENSQGTAWLLFFLGGTYYPSGVYKWDGGAWISDRNAIAGALANLDKQIHTLGFFLLDSPVIADWIANYGLGVPNEYNYSLNVVADATNTGIEAIADNSLRYIRPAGYAIANQTISKFFVYTGNSGFNVDRVCVFKATYPNDDHNVNGTVTVLLNEAVNTGRNTWNAADFISTSIAKDEIIFVVFKSAVLTNIPNNYFELKCTID